MSESKAFGAESAGKSPSPTAGQPFKADEKAVCEALVAGFYHSGLITAGEFEAMKQAIYRDGRANI